MRNIITSPVLMAVMLALSGVGVGSATAMEQDSTLVQPRHDWQQVLVVDAGVTDAEIMIKAAAANMHVIRLNATEDGLSQLSRELAKATGIKSLHILAHGEPGSLSLGNGAVTTASLQQTQSLKALSGKFAAGADVMIYGCDLAANRSGQLLVETLGKHLGTDVAASTDLTGAATLGGNWVLEHKLGHIDSQLFASQDVLNAYTGTLSHFRGGSVKWQPADLDGDGDKDDVKFFVNTAWRLNGQQTPSLQSDTGLAITSLGSAITQHITDTDPNSAYSLVSGTFKALNVDPNQLYKIKFTSCCRISGLKNNSGGPWDIQTLVNTKDGNQAPGIEMPIILEVAQLQADGVSVESNWTYQLNVVDPNGDQLRFRMANLEELGGGSSVNAPNLSIDANTGLITWTGSGTMATGLYSAGFVVEDLDINGNVKSKTHVDTILYLQNKAPTVNFQLSDNVPKDTKTVLVDADTPFTFSISGAGITSSNVGNYNNTANQAVLLKDANGTDYSFSATDMLPGTYPINFEIKEAGRIKSYLTINFVVADPMGPQVIYYPGDGAYSVNGTSTFMDVGQDGQLSDPDDNIFNGGHVRLEVGQVSSDDTILNIDSHGDATGQLRIDGSNVYFEGLLFGVIDVNETGINKALKINFTTDDATNTAVQTLIRNLVFSTSGPAATDPQYSKRNASLVVADPSGRSNLFTTTVTVGENSNIAPVANGILPNVTSFKTAALNIPVANGFFTDADGDSLTYSAIGMPPGVTFDPGTQTFTGATATVGTHFITVSADDGKGAVATASFKLIINANNAPVVIATPADSSTSEDAAITPIALAGVFSDDDAITLAVTGLPAGLSYDVASQSIIGTPTVPGTYSITITATDTAGVQALTAFNLTVTNSNDAPIAAAALSDQALDIILSPRTYAVAPGSFTDEDIAQGQGDILTYSASLIDGSPLPKFISFNPATQGFTFTHGWYDIGSYSVEVMATDKAGSSASQSFAVEVTGTNTMPMKHHWTDFAINEGEKRFFVHNDLHFMDKEQNYSDVTYILKQLPAHGTLLKNGAVMKLEDSFSQQDIEDEKIIEYQHDGSETTTDSFHFIVDDKFGGVTALQTDYKFDISPMNDNPVADQGIANQITTSGKPYSFGIPLDAFTDSDGDNLSYSLSDLPAWASFDGSKITGTPSAEQLGDTVITVTADDGHGTPVSVTFTLSVLLDSDLDGIPDTLDTDDDNDGVADTQDAFPLDPNESVDTDGDGIGNNADSDDDGDGMPDAWEIEHGLNPLDPNDAQGDVDNDGRSNLDEFNEGSNPRLDDVAPIVTTPADLSINARALFTRVDLSLLQTEGVANAIDLGNETCCTVTAEDVPANGMMLRPGRHVIIWKAVDAAGNIGTAEQIVDIYPTISFGKDATVSEGSDSRFKVVLNGDSPAYPVVVDYSVAGNTDAEDHNLVSGTVIIEQGVEATVPFTVFKDDTLEGEERINLEFVGEQNWGVKHTQLTRIVEQNVAPELTLQARQNGRLITIIAKDAGMVELDLSILDDNAEHDIQWRLPDGVSAEMDDSKLILSLDPTLLVNGYLPVTVTVTDNGEPPMTSEVTLMLRVIPNLPEMDDGTDTDADGISDLDEGMADTDQDGIPDYLDNLDETHLLPEQGRTTDAYIVEADAGVKLALGEVSFGGVYDGAQVSDNDFALAKLAADEVPNVGGYFDFIASELPEKGQSVSVVMPQRQAVPERALYRKYIDGQGWLNFVEDANNQLKSAPGEAGFCPAPGSAEYQTGLNQGDWCVQLTIQDGGPNDTDGKVNGTVKDPGGVGQPKMMTVEVTTKGSGGAMGTGMIILVGLMAGFRRFGRKAAGLLALLGLSFGANATELSADNLYLQAGAGVVKSNVSELEVMMELAEISSTAKVTNFDNNGTGHWLDLGYKLDEHLAVELGYMSLDSVGVSFTDQVSQLELDSYLEKVAFTHPDSASGFTLAAAYLYPVSDQVTVSGRAGLFRWDGDYGSLLKVSGDQYAYQTEAQKGTDWFIGMGLDYQPITHWTLGVAIRSYRMNDFHSELLALTMGYDF